MCSVVSICLGVAGLMLSITVTEAARLPSQGMGHVLAWMDRLGLVREPSPYQPGAWRPVGLLDFTDPSVFEWGLGCSVGLAVASMLAAIWAEHRREGTLGSGVGFILGVSTLHVQGFLYSVSALILGYAFLTFVRGRRRA